MRLPWMLTAPDRLARNYVHQMVLLEEFEQHGCQVDFLDRPMNQYPHDQLLLQIRGAVAEYERPLITERMRRVAWPSYAPGYCCRGPGHHTDIAPHPDRPRDPGGVTVDSGEAAVVAEIYAHYLEPGVGLLQVQRMLGERHICSPTGKPTWGLATIRGILTNPAYAGRMRYRSPSIRRSATHPIGRPHDSGTLVPPAEWILVATVPVIVTKEHVAGPLQQLPLPFGHLVRVNVILLLLHQFRQPLVAFERRQRHLGFECS